MNVSIVLSIDKNAVLHSRDEGLVSVEEYSSKILDEVGPKHWLMHLMKELDSAG